MHLNNSRPLWLGGKYWLNLGAYTSWRQLQVSRRHTQQETERTGQVSKGKRLPGAPQHELISEPGTKHWLDLGAVYHDLPLHLGTA
jgi:hypothetical protein